VGKHAYNMFTLQKTKGQRKLPNPLFLMARPGGFEPPTFRFVVVFIGFPLISQNVKNTLTFKLLAFILPSHRVT
jgi:hypothetical protein